mmetsp:Transcript_27588/g.65465  ORF Transcript_27588/g.65465 Transcript_27588/m.65465 type:complete len:392 (+) Transcript_27588:417-1592(+)
MWQEAKAAGGSVGRACLLGRPRAGVGQAPPGAGRAVSPTPGLELEGLLQRIAGKISTRSCRPPSAIRRRCVGLGPESRPSRAAPGRLHALRDVGRDRRPVGQDRPAAVAQPPRRLAQRGADRLQLRLQRAASPDSDGLGSRQPLLIPAEVAQVLARPRDGGLVLGHRIPQDIPQDRLLQCVLLGHGETLTGETASGFPGASKTAADAVTGRSLGLEGAAAGARGRRHRCRQQEVVVVGVVFGVSLAAARGPLEQRGMPAAALALPAEGEKGVAGERKVPRGEDLCEVEVLALARRVLDLAGVLLRGDLDDSRRPPAAAVVPLGPKHLHGLVGGSPALLRLRQRLELPQRMSHRGRPPGQKSSLRPAAVPRVHRVPRERGPVLPLGARRCLG